MFGFTKSDALFEQAARDPEAGLALLRKLKFRRNLAGWMAAVSFTLILLSVLASFLIVGGMTNGAGLKYADLLEQVLRFLKVLVPIFVGSCLGMVFVNQDVKMVILATGSPRGQTDTTAKPDNPEPQSPRPPEA